MTQQEGVIAIVGGSRGTGAELSRELLETGHIVMVGYAEKDIKANQVAGFLDPDKKRVVLDPPTFGDRARVAQIDVTNPESRLTFATEVRKFAEAHDTTVSTLVLLGAAGIGKPIRETFAVNQEGQVLTARTFWEVVDDKADPVAMTMFAQSFQGHTVFYPDLSARAKYPDDYSAVALSKWNGEVDLRLLNLDLNQDQSDGRHVLAVVVGDALGDSDPIMMLKRRAGQAQDRIDAGKVLVGDEIMVEQIAELDDHDEELIAAGFKPVTTAAYAGLMREIISARAYLPREVQQITQYIPEKLVVGNNVVDLRPTGTPLEWSHGKLTTS